MVVIVSKKIGEYITLTNVMNLFVLGINNNQVRLGIDAKPEAIVIIEEGIAGKKSLADFEEFNKKPD